MLLVSRLEVVVTTRLHGLVLALRAGVPALAIDPAAGRAAAACTERLRISCAVFVTTLHSPVHLAKSLSTLDQLAGASSRSGSAPAARGGRLPPSAWTRPGTSRGSPRGSR